MAQDLTTPEIQSITHQGVTAIVFSIPHKTDMTINRITGSMVYEVTSWNSTGEVVEQQHRSVLFPDWPTAFKTDMSSVYNKIEQDAINNGLIGDGTPETL
jgi:hypothetical protein